MANNNNMSKVVSWLLILFTMALVAWIRLLPLQLPYAEVAAEKIVRQRLHDNIFQNVRNRFPQFEWQTQTEWQLQKWINSNTDKWNAEIEEVKKQLKSELSYQDNEGNKYTYLGDADSYVWLRNARNYLRTGTVCDVIVNDHCRDNYSLAPVGLEMRYAHSVHVAAIIGVHKLITLFIPDYPLPASAFFVPVLLSIVGIIPAFFIGRCLAGNLGGFCAAIHLSLYTVVLGRTIGSDNDIWNVVLPLFAVWSVITALTSNKRFWQVIYSILGGGVIGLQADIWNGWFFIFYVLVCGLLTTLIFFGLYNVFQSRSIQQTLKDSEIHHTVSVLLIFVLASILFVALASIGNPNVSLSYGFENFIKYIIRISQAADHKTVTNIFPDTYQTVSELQYTNILATLSDKVSFILGLSGILLLTVLTKKWMWIKLLIISILTLSTFFYVLKNETPNGFTVVLLLSICIILLLLFQTVNNGQITSQYLEIKPRLLIIIWFLAAFYLVFKGERFLLLWAPPLAISFAVVVGRIHIWISEKISGLNFFYLPSPTFSRMNKQNYFKNATQVVLFALLASTLIPAVKAGYDFCYYYRPVMNSAWWDTLTDIRNHTDRSAIVSTVWSYGYWVKYVADRRTTVDGGTLNTHVPYWMNKVLAAPSEDATINVMRMLNCGSDATPLPEGKYGAFGKIKAMGYDDVEVYSILTNIINNNKIQAIDYLHKIGFSETQSQDIISSTHCQPPDSYLIISTNDLSTSPAWLHSGSWDPRRAYVANRVKFLSESEAVDEFHDKLGYTPGEAAYLYRQAIKFTTNTETDDFITPGTGSLVPIWIKCKTQTRDNKMLCKWDQGNILIQINVSLLNNIAIPGRLLRFTKKDVPVLEKDNRPGIVLLADQQGIHEILSPSPARADLAVLVDPIDNQLLVGSPALVKSMFVQLAILNGRYLHRLKKVSEHPSIFGYKVTTWRVSWD